jgi:hypothetical protein
MTTALIGSHRVVGLASLRTLPGGKNLLVASFYHAKGRKEYFPLFYINPQTQAALTGNHFLTACSSWTDPSQPPPWGDDSPDFPPWSRPPEKISSSDMLYRLRI